MRITINELRHIIREEIEAAYASEELDEGLGKWLAGAALAGGLALGAGAMKDSGAKPNDTTSPTTKMQTSTLSAEEKAKIENKVDGMNKEKINKLIGELKRKVDEEKNIKNLKVKVGKERDIKHLDKKDIEHLQFFMGLENLETGDLATAKSALKTFATDVNFPHHQTVVNTILAFQ